MRRTVLHACARLEDLSSVFRQDKKEIGMDAESLAIAALRPDIIFMDVMMPGLDGFQACALIRASPQFGETPVVLISGNDVLLDRTRAELAGEEAGDAAHSVAG